MVSRSRQAKQIERYKAIELPDALADHAALEMYRQGVMPITRLPALLGEYAKPRHAEWGERKAWTLFNAATQTLEGHVAEDPSRTTRLHRIIDGVCEKLAA
jgi:3-deoxy-D-arabino-heptulosonate 7-phosphate (DAHP) synthase class II